jgi:hypothetical protein
MRFLAPLLLLAGCATTQQGELPSGKELKDPKRLLPVFKEFLRAGELSKAHECLSKGAKSAVPYEAFFAVFTGFEGSARMITGLEEHGLTETTIRICNPEFGISRDFKIVKEFKIIWKLDLTREDLQYFQDRALEWFRRQNTAAGHRHYVYPPDWKYAPVMPRCDCKKNG